MIDISAALDAKGWSDRTAGAAIHAAWKRHERRASYPTPASIAAKLGRLKAGDSTWWKRHPHALSAFAKLLPCLIEELLPDGAAAAAAIDFPQFPELATLLAGQDPCAVRDDLGWVGALADAAIRRGTHSWIVAEPGTGKTLAIRVLRQRHDNRILATTTRRLCDAAREARDNVPLIVEVEAVDSASDQGALIELTRRSTNVCVLAAFSRPSLGASDARWVDYSWEMSADWRERMMRWSQARLPKPAQLDTEDILAWLMVIDPKQRLFRTPGDLLSLLGRAYRAGLPTGPNALRDLGHEALAQKMGADPHEWVRHVGVSVVETMIAERFKSLQVPLAPLDIETWANLVPKKLTPVRSQSPSKSAKVRSKSVEVASVESPPTLQVVHLLVDAGVLQHRDGGLDASAWIQVGIERETIVREIKSGSARWALWAVDDARKDAVDEALDTLSPFALVASVRSTIAFDDSALEAVAAVEALFAAVGRRLLAGTWAPTPEMLGPLQALGTRQLRLLNSMPTDGTVMRFMSLTRQRPGADRAWYYSWLAEAWAFSLGVERPKTLDHDPRWWLPGWKSALQLSEAPDQLPLPEPLGSVEGAACRRLLDVARRIVASCVDDTAPEDVPHLLLPWVVIDGPRRGWSVNAGCEHLLLRGHLLAQIVGELIEPETPDLRVAVATTAWRSAAAEANGSPSAALFFLSERAPALLKIVVDDLPSDVFAASISADALDRSGVAHDLNRLPPRFLRAVLPVVVRCVRDKGRPIRELAPLVDRLGEDDLDLLVELTVDRWGAGMAAAKRVWLFAPDRAMHEARSALARGEDVQSYALFAGAPRGRFAALLDLLDEAGKTPISWKATWLIQSLPTAGSAAGRAYNMMKFETSPRRSA